MDTGTHTTDALNTITGANENALAPETSVPVEITYATIPGGWVWYPKIKQIVMFPSVSPHSGNGQLQGGNAICSREWLTAPPLAGARASGLSGGDGVGHGGVWLGWEKTEER